MPRLPSSLRSHALLQDMLHDVIQKIVTAGAVARRRGATTPLTVVLEADGSVCVRDGRDVLDPALLPSTDVLDADRLKCWLDELAILNPGLELRLLDERGPETFENCVYVYPEQPNLFTDTSTLVGELLSCQTTDPREAELFLVESGSAGASVKKARDRRFQAVLPLSSRDLSLPGADLPRLLANETLKRLVTALGCGIEQNGRFDHARLRYHTIVLMADADVDGAHVRAVVLSFLHRVLPRLIQSGHVYLAEPPRYGGHFEGEDSPHFFFSTESDVRSFQAGLYRKLILTRYESLGALTAAALGHTMLHPAHRTLHEVTTSDVDAARSLLGSLDAAECPDFYLKQAKIAQLALVDPV